MSDPVSMSLDDYIKSQKKTGGKSGYNRRGGKPKANAASPRAGGGGAGSYRGGRNNSFRGRKGQQQANNNGQGRWNKNRNRRNQGQYAGGTVNAGGNFRHLGGGGGGAGNQGQNRRLSPKKRPRNVNRQQRRQRNSLTSRGQVAAVQGPSRQRYFTSPAVAGTPAARPRRNQTRRLRLRNKLNGVAGISPLIRPQTIPALSVSRNNKRAVLKLAKKRVQRAKLLVTKKKAGVVGGNVKLRKIIASTSTGRLALSKNGFVTIKNTKAKQMERALVQMKIARAQQARNNVSPQAQRNPKPLLRAGGKRRPQKVANPRVRDWNAPIVRTMTNDHVDEMTSSELNPDIQRKIAFIQSRSKGDRAPVMPDFKAPVTTSRMKLSDRFRLLRDQ